MANQYTGRKFDESDCVVALQEAASILGEAPSQAQYTDLDVKPNHRTIAQICGSWSKAKEMAGLDTHDRQLHVNEDYFKSINKPAKAYWLGLLTGDGSVWQTRTGTWAVKLELQTEDRHIIEDLKSSLDSDHAIVDRGRKQRLQIVNDRLVSHLREWGVNEDKTYSGTAPELADPTHQRAYVRGLTDADGTFTPSSRWCRWRIASRCYDRLDAIRDWLPFEAEVREGEVKYDLAVTRPMENGSKVVKYLYPDGATTEPALERKKKQALSYL